MSTHFSTVLKIVRAENLHNIVLRLEYFHIFFMHHGNALASCIFVVKTFPVSSCLIISIYTDGL